MDFKANVEIHFCFIIMPYELIISNNFNNIPIEIYNFKPYFFNEIEHLQLQREENECYTFYWQNVNNQTIEARFSIIIHDNVAYSPFKATFGGIEFHEEIAAKNLFEFLNKIVQFLQSLRVKSLLIKSYPAAYLSEYQDIILKKCLSKLHFLINYTDQNYEILVSDKSFYETVIGTRTKQLLRTYIKKGYGFKQELDPNIVLIHAFIARSRMRKNRLMTMNEEQLTQHFKIFPKNFQLFSVTHSNISIAMGVTIKINEEILYTFYLADEENHLKNSPITFLLSGIYEYSQREKFKILDLGIATEKGVLNEGLARFKQNLGAKISAKKEYFLSL